MKNSSYFQEAFEEQFSNNLSAATIIAGRAVLRDLPDIKVSCKEQAA